VSPFTPAVGLSVMEGSLTVNVAVAWSPVPADPTAVMVEGPVATEATTNVHIPVIEPLMTEQLIGEWLTAAPLTITLMSEVANPLPDTVTVSPTTALEGASVMVGMVTLRGAVAVSIAGDPSAVIV
jgi:hypothetical protein